MTHSLPANRNESKSRKTPAALRLLDAICIQRGPRRGFPEQLSLEEGDLAPTMPLWQRREAEGSGGFGNKTRAGGSGKEERKGRRDREREREREQINTQTHMPVSL